MMLVTWRRGPYTWSRWQCPINAAMSLVEHTKIELLILGQLFFILVFLVYLNYKSSTRGPAIACPHAPIRVVLRIIVHDTYNEWQETGMLAQAGFAISSPAELVLFGSF